MSKLVAVKFLKAWNGYSADEVAGFDSATAERLVAGEVAELHKPKRGGSQASGKPNAQAVSDSGAEDGAEDEAKP